MPSGPLGQTRNGRSSGRSKYQIGELIRRPILIFGARVSIRRKARPVSLLARQSSKFNLILLQILDRCDCIDIFCTGASSSYRLFLDSIGKKCLSLLDLNKRGGKYARLNVKTSKRKRALARPSVCRRARRAI